MQVWNRRDSILSITGALLILLVLVLAGGRLWIPVAGIPLAAGFYYLSMRRYFRRRRWLREPFPESWRNVLQQHVHYYRRLSESEQKRFESDVLFFLNENRITPIATTIDDAIRVLIAASAVVLTFGHPEWEYRRLPEILVYPHSFDEHYSTTSHRRKRTLSGMAVPQGAIILAKDELLEAFEPESGPHHVAIHEFAHALDMADGAAEGIPADLPAGMLEEWHRLIREELRKVRKDESILDPYAGKNSGELFAVAVEHFFQQPHDLKESHPQLYEALSRFFLQDPAK